MFQRKKVITAQAPTPSDESKRSMEKVILETSEEVAVESNTVVDAEVNVPLQGP